MAYTKDNTYPASIKKRTLLSKQGSSKRCFHIELAIDPDALSYTPGDSIGILPQNSPDIVNKIISLLKAKAGVTFFSSRYQKQFPLFDFLTHKANLSKATSGHLNWLLPFCSAETREKIKPLLSPDHKAQLTEFLHNHEIWDLIEELKPENVPIQEFCDKLLPQMPKFYSIASSQKTHPAEIHLTVAEVSYTSRGHARLGVGSHFLCKLAEETTTKVPLYIQPSNGFCLPLDSSAPIIMIGPGTGVAPFRGFLQERAFEQASGKNWLFFGDRNREFDFYYHHFWEELEKKNLLKLTTAFSRDQEKKIYVSHRIEEHSKEMWEWIQKGAYIYVCGDATQMARDVGLALQEVVRKEGKLSEEAAIKFLKQMKTDKRYLLDVY
jgi:sulfite reductase (NADPH) flavoprotein alpha-component